MDTQNTSSTTFDLGSTLAVLLLRIWLGIRAIQTGIEKYAGYATVDKEVDINGTGNAYGLTETSASKSYSLDMYNGVPAGLYEKLSQEPLISKWGLDLYSSILGPALIILGVLLLLGICSRLTLFGMGLLYTSLTYGLILLNQSGGVAWLAIHIILIVAMLILSKHNRLQIIKKL